MKLSEIEAQGKAWAEACVGKRRKIIAFSDLWDAWEAGFRAGAADGIERSAEMVDRYRRIDKYASAYQIRAYLLKAEALVRALSAVEEG